jgi:hypothetical protein
MQKKGIERTGESKRNEGMKSIGESKRNTGNSA